MKIKFVPINVEVDVDPNRSVLQIAGDNNVHIRSICKGVPSCAECRVKIVDGDSNVIPPNKAELNLIGSSYHIDSRRLSCQMHCFGPVTIDVSDHLDRTEAPSKKIRGFKSQKPHESHAVQDTLILTEPEQAAVNSNENQARERHPSQRVHANHQQRERNQGPRNQQQAQGPRNQGQGQGQRNQGQQSQHGSQTSQASRGPQQSQGGQNRGPGRGK